MMSNKTRIPVNMMKRFLLTLPLLLLTQCTPAVGTRHVAAPPPASVSVETQQQIPVRAPEEQLEFFNEALDKA
jgi:hypothetical protein